MPAVQAGRVRQKLQAVESFETSRNEIMPPVQAGRVQQQLRAVERELNALGDALMALKGGESGGADTGKGVSGRGIGRGRGRGLGRGSGAGGAAKGKSAKVTGFGISDSSSGQAARDEDEMREKKEKIKDTSKDEGDGAGEEKKGADIATIVEGDRDRVALKISGSQADGTARSLNLQATGTGKISQADSTARNLQLALTEERVKSLLKLRRQLQAQLGEAQMGEARLGEAGPGGRLAGGGEGEGRGGRQRGGGEGGGGERRKRRRVVRRPLPGKAWREGKGDRMVEVGVDGVEGGGGEGKMESWDADEVGGILGDEMGLGKTVQVAAFLASLLRSGLYRPSLLVCPVTLLRQWQREVRIWCPELNPVILHDSGGIGEADGEEAEEEEEGGGEEEGRGGGLARGNSLVITTYEQVRLRRELFLAVDWGYAILDEGHRIRNPDADTTIACKQLRTPHRLLLSGSPIQNRLDELWSLMDFLHTPHRLLLSGSRIQNRLAELWSLMDSVYPGRLGTLPVFSTEFALPIVIGGYLNAQHPPLSPSPLLPPQRPFTEVRLGTLPVFSTEFALPIAIGGYLNATPLQVATAYKCAVVLRDVILPYLLRRVKADVDIQLPEKTERVLLVPITRFQRTLYRAFLQSEEMRQILERYRNSFSKLQVLDKILHVWKAEGHRALVFCQTQQMLDIVESLVLNCNFGYRRMDGSTPPGLRAALIDEFNSGEGGVFVFLLTTRVGGLGTNLTGANRVVIFDPDWNPSTDLQPTGFGWIVKQRRWQHEQKQLSANHSATEPPVTFPNLPGPAGLARLVFQPGGGGGGLVRRAPTLAAGSGVDEGMGEG
ncbi:unnamed protein product [Closterium sp. NIES-65]|nr:unnamed protein product [Closterium sp. NIES-65]